MFFPFLPSTHTSVLHILKLVCWTPTQYQNEPMLELNGYEKRPIAASGFQISFQGMMPMRN